MPVVSDGLLAYCRPGFEAELAAELSEHAAQADMYGYARAVSDSGFVEFLGIDGAQLAQTLPLSALIFARQKLVRLVELRDLDPTDRIGPMLQSLSVQLPKQKFSELIVEHPDSDQARPLAGLARSLGNALRSALRAQQRLNEKNRQLPRLHVCLLSGNQLLLALADPHDSAPWPGGIARLRHYADAPSRSALKLDEALLCLLSDDERQRYLQPGMSAADLGAAPGGWTSVLVRHHLRVFAIDNGPIAPALLDSGVVDHLRADGFRWQPPKPLEWMVCDMVEQPIRVVERMATWLREGWCQRTIFNLKLPMKKRWQETQRCLETLRIASGKPIVIRAKHLYHDREEITVFAAIRD